MQHDKIYIDGAWVPSTGTGTIDVYDSTNGEVIGTIPEGTADDVDAAAKAAAAAFEAWSQTSPEERAKFCTRIAEGLGARTDEIATVVTREAGMPKWLSTIVQAGCRSTPSTWLPSWPRATSTRHRSATAWS